MGDALTGSIRARTPPGRRSRVKPESVGSRAGREPAEPGIASAGLPRYLENSAASGNVLADAANQFISAQQPLSTETGDTASVSESIAETIEAGTQLPRLDEASESTAPEPQEGITSGEGLTGNRRGRSADSGDRGQATSDNTGDAERGLVEDAPRTADGSNGDLSHADGAGDEDSGTTRESSSGSEAEVSEGADDADGAAEDRVEGGVDADGSIQGGGVAADDAGGGDVLAALATGDIALIDTELAEHQRWGAASARVGAAGSEARADFIVQQAGAGALGALGQGALMGAAMGAGGAALDIGAARLVARLAGPALARSFPIPAIGAVIGGVFSAYDLATRDWGRTGETIGRFGEGGSIYEQLANSIAAVSEIIGIATAVLNVIAGVIGAISIAMWIITVLTVGVASPLAATLSTIAAAIGIATMILDGINALVLQRLVTLFRALHTFTSQADPTDVVAQGGRIGEAAAASAGFVGGMAGGLTAGAATGAAGRRLGLDPHAPPRVPDAEAPRAATGDGPTITADPPPPDAAALAGDRPPSASPEPVAPRAMADDGLPIVEPAAPRPMADQQAPSASAHDISGAQGEAAPVVAGEGVTPQRAAEPEQLSFPGFDEPVPGRRALTPNEIAPPDANSAWLRRLRAEAEGAPPPAPGRRAGNIARHEIPDRANVAGSWESTSPTPDLYQHSPRSPAGHESHHVEQQSAFRAPDGGEVIPGYNPREDPTVMMRRDPEHQATFQAQAEQRAQPDFHETVGTAGALEEAHNIAVWGTRDAPPPGTTRPQLMDPRVAGQTVMEHSGYLFETSRLSGDIGPEPGVLPRPGETPLADRPTVGELVGPRGGVDPFENIDWDATFNQPDPHALAQPPGTQLGLFGEHSRPTSPGPEQLSLPLPEPANPNQMNLPFEGPSEVASPRAMAEPTPGRRPTRSTRPLTAAEVEAHVQALVDMGVPRDRIRVGDRTVYDPRNDTIVIGPDVNALPPSERPAGLANPANTAVEAQGVLAHEAIGHREAQLSGQVRDARWHEEFQASTRAALHDPNLSPEQRWLLMQDAEARRRHAPNDDTIYVWTGRHGVPEPPTTVHPPRPEGHFRSQDQLPSVIIDEGLVSRPGATATAPELGTAPIPGVRTARDPTSGGTPRRMTDVQTGQLATSARPGTGVLPSVGTVSAVSAVARTAASDREGTASGSGVLAPQAGGIAGQRTISSTEGAPRSEETRYSAGFARGARAAVFGSPTMRLAGAAREAYFGSGTRDERIARGGTVGGVVGGVFGGPAGAVVGAAVGAGVSRRAEDFNAGLERGAEPVVERVNPAYPPPPGNGTRQEIVDMQNRLLDILSARTKAEALENAMASDAAHHEANSTPLSDLNQRTGETLTAAQAHRQATEQREAANQRQQAEESNVSGALSDYGNRAAGLVAITGPLEAFTRFTSLAHSLPDSPRVLVGAKRGILKMNSDGQNFLNALNGIDSAVAEQQAATPSRNSNIEANAGSLAAASAGNAASQGQLGEAQAGGQALAARNDARAADSRQRESQAAQTGARLDSQAEDQRAQITDLAAQWQAWAQAHRQARLDAMAQTRAAMVARGWRPREESTGVAE